MQMAVMEPLIGIVNGINRDFRTSAPYISGTLIVFLNGVALQEDVEGGWVELGSGRLRMNEAPITGDAIQVYFRPL